MRTAVAPDFEIFKKTEIMRMISFFLPDLRLSAIGAPELRIAAPDGWGMTLTQKLRMCIAPEVRIANPCAWLRCILEDYILTALKRMDLAGGRPSPGRKRVSDCFF